MIKTMDSLEYVSALKEYSQDIMFCDPPYALGSEVIVRPDGKVDYKKAVDFMGKWEMPTGDYWEQWFKEAYRTLKYGGHLVMYGMDRQLLLFKYYGHLAGFAEKQSMYWYFISNFPKATDLSKMTDKNAGAEVRSTYIPNHRNKSYGKGLGGGETDNTTKPSTPLGKKYDGYKYSIAPLKQTNETILVFQKPYKTGSCLHDTLKMEDGDETCTCGALDIDGNRVGTETIGGGTMPDLRDVGKMSKESIGIDKLSFGQNVRPAERKQCEESVGRYPAQTFCDSNTAEVLDGQGDVSKVLHKCKYEEAEHDLYIYQPKVSKAERNAGCDGFEYNKKHTTYGEYNGTAEHSTNKNSVAKNNHPTLKPIALNEKILRLFKTPCEQTICYPFAGAGSEIIGGIKAGFNNWHGCEINEEYVEIANARIEHWKNKK